MVVGSRTGAVLRRYGLSIFSVPSVYSVRLVLLALTLLHYYIERMLILILRTIISALRSYRELALENRALRHQINILINFARSEKLLTAIMTKRMKYIEATTSNSRHTLAVFPDSRANNWLPGLNVS